MILWPILAGIYLICVVGSYKLAMTAVGEDYVAKPLVVFLSLFWPITLFYTYLKAAVA
jgi:hypothetical protein